MERFITDNLITWKNQSRRKPLILRGARQVGKSWIVTEFGKKHFTGRIHLVNFEKYPEWHGIFEKNLDVKRIINELEIVLNERIVTGKDLLFFDEIQSCPKAITSLRYFYEDLPDQHIIAAGSLLEFAFRDISVPVGRVQFLNLYPMSFPEFLWAQGKNSLVDIVLATPVSLSETLHNTLLSEVRSYLLVGGMPESVKKFIETGRTRDCFGIQRDLINTFRQDFSKYAPYSDKRCLNSVLNSVAKQVGKQIIYTHLTDQFTGPTIKKAFDLLEQAQIVHRIPSSSASGLPLEASASSKKFKALVLDVGIMQQLCGWPVDSEYLGSDILSLHRGALAEQFVGQQLIAARDEGIHYWARDARSSTAEVDFLISRKGRIYPVEVKSGASGKLRSLHLLLKNFPDCPAACVLSEGPFGVIREQKINFLPLYYAYQIGMF